MAHKVLVVDDEDSIRGLVHDSLTSCGYEVIMASSGEEAIKLSISESPDVILLDWIMPGIDGLETCRRLRVEERTRYIPIIVITGFGTTKMEATDTGADDFINKPFKLNELALRIKSVLRIGHIANPSERLTAYMYELEKNRSELVLGKIEKRRNQLTNSCD